MFYFSTLTWSKSTSKLFNTYFKLQHQIHPLLAKGVDVIEDESDDDVNPIAFMGSDAILRENTSIIIRGLKQGRLQIVSANKKDEFLIS